MAKSSREIELTFPLGGLDRRFAYQTQPPWTTPDCLNVRPEGPIEGRERGGSRPGLMKAYPTLLAGGKPIRLLNDVTYMEGGQYEYWSDDFHVETFGSETLGSVWSAASWHDQLPKILPQDGVGLVYLEDGGAVLDSDAVSIDSTAPYAIEVYIVPYMGAHHGSYEIYARMDATTPNVETDGITAHLDLTGTSGAYDGYLSVMVAGVDQGSYPFAAGSITEAAAMPGWFQVLINSDTITCSWQGVTLVNQAIATQTDLGIGFGLAATVAGGMVLLDAFRVQYQSETATDFAESRYRTALVASADGSLYREYNTVDLSEESIKVLTTDLTLASDRMLMSTERTQKLYIADTSDKRIEETDGVATGTVLKSTKAGDWTTHGIDAHDDMISIIDGTSTVEDGTYAIASVAPGQLNLATDIGTGACSYRIERGPKVYDPVVGSLALMTSTEGFVPVGCPLICTYRDRIVFAGDPQTPHLWYMSKQADPTDWDYSEVYDDVSRAVAGTSETAGLVGDPITALIPHEDDYLLMGCPKSLWVLRGDPAYDGQIDNVSRDVGIVSKGAWCKGPAGEVYFLAVDGVYVLAPGATTKPIPLSARKVPNYLKRHDATQSKISMQYDAEGGGVHLFVTPIHKSNRRHWWIDIAGNDATFWPVKLQEDHEPTCTHTYKSFSRQESGVMLGCRDGYIRRFDPRQATDDGTEIDSYVLIGPLRLGGSSQREGRIESVQAALGEGSGSVDWSVQVGDTAQGAVSNSTFLSGTWARGANRASILKARGVAGVLKLANAGKVPWAWEAVTMWVTRLRKRIS